MNIKSSVAQRNAILVSGAVESELDAELDAIDTGILLPDEEDNCPAGFFHCNTTAQCVPQRANCDGSVDCDDKSDEWNCVNNLEAKYWDHLFRKSPFGRQGMDDIPIGECCE